LLVAQGVSSMEVKKDGDRFIFIHEDQFDSNSPVIKCLIDNKEAPFEVINNPEANQHARWQLITKELEFAESQLVIALERCSKSKAPIVFDRRNVEGVIIKALIDSAIIGYIKCFNQTSGRRVKLEVRNLFPSKNESKYIELHTSLKKLRDSYIAHAGISNNEASHMIATVDPVPKAGVSSEVVLAHSYFTLPNLDVVQSMLELVRYVLAQHTKGLQEKLNTFCQKVIDNPSGFKVESVFSKRN
jgi:hypothetical protein